MADVLTAGAHIATTAAGAVLMAAGLAVLGYATYLVMINAAHERWFDRAALLAPAGLVTIIAGLALAVR